MNFFYDSATVCASVMISMVTTLPVLGHAMLVRICASEFVPRQKDLLSDERFPIATTPSTTGRAEHFCSRNGKIRGAFSLKQSRLSMDKDRIEGSAEEAKGKVKEVAGKALGDKKTETEGKADQVKGKVQNAVGGGRREAPPCRGFSCVPETSCEATRCYTRTASVDTFDQIVLWIRRANQKSKRTRPARVHS
jgi:uncharacterized protein YjbJ (UPF0337 family)